MARASAVFSYIRVQAGMNIEKNSAAFDRRIIASFRFAGL
jgi:hypothetical protein